MRKFVQSDLSGTNIANSFNNSRQQTSSPSACTTARQCGQGWQGGAVYDWLDDRFYTRARFEQIRPEISYIFAGGNEFGYWGAFGTGANQTQTVNGVLLSFNSVNMNAFFYRKNFTTAISSASGAVSPTTRADCSVPITASTCRTVGT